ncbi:MAG: acyl carrier protein [Lachnospiraceae bacterium]|uniref:Acyl carrier protein n=1 Tax=Candidatus Weimeria bifida TaxID=2599074 RepID=A0A6N7IZN0_9FIRM|nr:acyl carrier protein [Candidatus Weimeria bifida]RRF96535.1 MAG: acyl carrier protein [Lachnospiraceae bacterium]
MDFEKLQEIIADNLDADKEDVKPEAKLVDDLDADSLAVVELQMAIEDECGVKIPDEDIPKLVTVQDIMDEIEKCKNA